MRLVLTQVRAFLSEALPRLTPRLRQKQIGTVAMVFEFASTRSAFIAQKTLYGYVKTRMGTSYPKMFEDDVFIESINIAKMHIFAACLSDLTIFAIAHALEGDQVSDSERTAAARACYAQALAANTLQAVNGFEPVSVQAAFDKRLEGTDWLMGAKVWRNFNRSPRALVKWSPIAPELKQYDVEIVENSIKFAWQEVRSEYLKRLAQDSILDDWHRNGVSESARN